MPFFMISTFELAESPCFEESVEFPLEPCVSVVPVEGFARPPLLVEVVFPLFVVPPDLFLVVAPVVASVELAFLLALVLVVVSSSSL